MCRIGPSDTMFHCTKCNCCLKNSLLDNHICQENIMAGNCPICSAELSSVDPFIQLSCSHPIHVACYKEYIKHNYICPICSKSFINLTDIYREMDKQIENAVMEDKCRPAINILCNDCTVKSSVKYHILGNCCDNCKSYNTKRIQ
jgi:hypothetical protein